MDRRLDKIEDKLDIVSDKIASIDKTLAAQHVSLQEHIRRTNILENKLEPVERHVTMINGVLKAIGLLATIATIVGVVYEITKNLI